MVHRVGAAVAAAALAAMLFAPAQLNARGGTGMGVHGGGFHPPVRPTHPVHLPLVHRHDPLFDHRKFRERHAFEHRRHRRNDDGFGGYNYGGGGYGDGYGGNGYGDNDYADNDYGGYDYCNHGYGYGYPLTCRAYTAFYGRYYDPSDMTGSIWVPPYTVRPTSVMSTAGPVDPPINRGACRSETVTAPTPGGAERTVTITRC